MQSGTTTRVSVATCLWFDDQAEQAAEFYTSLIPGSRIHNRMRDAIDAPPLLVEFTLGGSPYQALNGGPHFVHSEAVSISVLTDSQQETDRLWAALTADGGSESQCGWLKDRFGVSWQIVPRRFIELQGSDDKAAVQRARQAMFSMRKLDLATLEAAFYGAAPAEGEDA